MAFLEDLTELGIGQDRGHLESHLFREPAIPEGPNFSLGEHKTTEQTRVLSESDVYFSSPPEPAQLMATRSSTH